MLFKRYKDELEAVTESGMFNILPRCSERGRWEAVDSELKTHIIKDAEKMLGYKWPRMNATDYLDYFREGSRHSFADKYKANHDALTKLVVGECVEGKGRFLDDIADGIYATCSDAVWVQPAHLHQYGDEHVPACENNYMDLRCTDTGQQLALVYYLLKPELDEVDAQICKWIEHELQVRILDRYLETEQWWMNFRKDTTINNWNTHCNMRVMTVALIMENDSDKLRSLMAKVMRSLDIFLSIYKPDGACNEGPGYWKGSGLAYLNILRFISDIYGLPMESFLDERIRNMGSYIYKVLINDDYYMSYADGYGRNSMFDVKLYQTGMASGDKALMELAVDVFRRHRRDGIFYDNFIYFLYDYVEYVFGYDELLAASSKPSGKSYYFKEAVLENAHIFAARQSGGSGRGFFTGIKGGHNDESHNHNDIGVFYLYLDGLPVIIDPGVGEYTKKTFSPDRYSIWTMQSSWHNLPDINGLGQAPGRKYESNDFRYAAAADISTAELDITKAYPVSTGLKRFKRTCVLDRGKETVSLNDNLKFIRHTSTVKWYLTLAYEPVIIKDGTAILFNGNSGILMEYDKGKFNVSIDVKDISDDKKLSESWGGAIYRICLETKGKSALHNINIRFKAAEGEFYE